MKIIVLAGGYSPERDVSLSSGSLIANALMERGHEVFFLDPWLGIKAGERVHYRTREEGLGFAYEIGGEAPDLELLGAETGAEKITDWPWRSGGMSGGGHGVYRAPRQRRRERTDPGSTGGVRNSPYGQRLYGKLTGNG
nr:D_ala_D_alaTIGR: D-alanine--D-alanine [uncultured bacterium]